jgi:iron-sulfur cluster assembly accessory protein
MAESSAFNLTPRAAAHVLKTMERDGAAGQGLRVAIITGGCSGYEYSLSFSDDPEPDDVLIEIDALRVFVEAASIDKLSGTVLDYVDGLYGGGLKFTNPQATHTCGCGTSFSTE